MSGANLNADPASLGSPSPWSHANISAFVAVFVLIGLALRWKVLGVPFFSDDYMQLGMLAGTYPGDHAAWDLYSFIRADPQELALHRAAGTLPWWTWEEINGSVLRPLSSLTLWLDWQLWPLDARASHLHSLAWWCAMVVAASRVLFRLLPSRVAALALAILVLDHGVSMNLGWVANRCALICATFCFAAIESHLHHRERGKARIAVATLLWLCAGLLAGEYGFVAFAYLFAIECYRGHESPRRAILSSIRVLWPALIPMLGYLAWHMLGDYGTFGESVYAHPLRTPLAYLSWLVNRLPRALAELTWSIPAGPNELLARPHFSWLGLPGLDALRWLPEGEWREGLTRLLRVQALVGTLLLAILVLAMRALRGPSSQVTESLRPNAAPRPVAALALGAVLGLLPVLVAPAHGRLFTLSQLGAALWLATFFWRSFDRLREGLRWRPNLVVGPIALWLAGVHLLADPAFSRVHIDELKRVHEPVVRSLQELAERNGGELGGRDVIVLSTRSHTAAVHGGMVLGLLGAPTPARWHVLSMGVSALSVQRVDDRTLVVFPTGLPLLTSPVENFFRPPRAPLETGDSFESGPFRVEVLRKVTDDEGDELPLALTALRLHFKRAIDDEHHVFLRTDSKDGSLHRVELPAAPGVLLVSSPIPDR